MKLTYTFIQRFMKLAFSAVLIQLFLIALGAGEGRFTPSAVTAMLEHSAAGALCALGSGILLEYILKTEDR